MTTDHQAASPADKPSADNRSTGRSNRGFASMDPEQQRRIASAGGRAAHRKGTAHEFDAEEARAAGRKGGEAVSQNREHMATIGRQGGQSSQGGRRSRAEANASTPTPSHAGDARAEGTLHGGSRES